MMQTAQLQIATQNVLDDPHDPVCAAKVAELKQMWVLVNYLSSSSSSNYHLRIGMFCAASSATSKFTLIAEALLNQTNSCFELNPLEFKGKYSATLNIMKLIHWPLMDRLLAVWLSGNALASINVVALRQTRLVLGWVTVCGRVNHFGM